MSTNNPMHALLKQRGLRVTPKRIAILTLLSQASAPYDVEHIRTSLSLKMDQATIYRTIDTLLTHNLIKQIDFREGKYRYELNSSHHHHLLCQNCGKITPIFDSCLTVDLDSIHQKYGFMIKDHALEFFGLCQGCNSN
jgi:Fe2+ or Zn2+ uptake regulation protein